MRFRIIGVLLLALLGACTSTPQRTDGPTAVVPPAARGQLPELSEGACGGFRDLAQGKSSSMLGDRVRVTGLEGATESGREDRVASLLSGSNLDWLKFGLGKEEFRVRATESYRRTGRDLFTAVQAKAEGAAVVSLPSSSGAIVVQFPKPQPKNDGEEDTDEPTKGKGPLLDAYVTTADGLVVVLSFFASEAALNTGGCERVALRLAGTARGGSRTLPMPSGDRQLLQGVAAQIPPGHVVSTHDMSHWLELHVHPIVAFDRPEPFLMIRFDRAPGRPELEQIPSTTVTAPAYGERAEWREWKDKNGRRWRDVIVSKGPYGKVLFAIGAGDDAMLGSLAQIAASVGDRKVVRSALPPCSTVARPPPAATPKVDEQVTTLLNARQFALDSEVFGAPRARELEAFRALAMRPDDERATAFRHLAEHGTKAGRLYGLAGLFYADPAAFEPVLCAVRDKLTGAIDVGLQCGTATRQAAELVESSSPRALRGEPFWGDRQWWSEGVRDLRGGALARSVWREALSGKQSDLASDGYVPPSVAASALPAPLTSGTKPARSPIAHIGGGLCWVREDGRVVCAGEVFSSTQAARKAGSRVILPPDMVRYPADLALGQGHTLCVLDAKGRRACAGGIASSLEDRYRRCGVPLPTQMTYRVFDDGPWSRLVALKDVCGIRRSDGALYCFLTGPSDVLPKFASKGQSLQQGHYRAHRVPVEGRVAGVAIGKEPGRYWAHYAFTEDGALWEWGVDGDPKVVGRFETQVLRFAHIAGSDFVTLRDGRVFARGFESDSDPFREGDRIKHPKWIEMKSLRGAQVHSPPDQSDGRGCAVQPNGQVDCWQQCKDRSHRGDDCKAKGRETVGFLQRSSELFLENFYTCGRQSAARLSCSGDGIEWIVGKKPAKGSVQLDLTQLAGSAVEHDQPAPVQLPPELLQQIRSQSNLGQ